MPYNYSATRDDQGQKLQDSYSKWQLQKVFDTASSNRAKLLTEQVAAISQLEDVRREGYVGSLATARDPKDNTVELQLNWLSQVSGADDLLGGKQITGANLSDRLTARRTRSGPLSDWLRGLDQTHAQQTSIKQNIAPEFSRVGLDAPSCEDIANKGKGSISIETWLSGNRTNFKGAEIAAAYGTLKDECAKVVSIEGTGAFEVTGNWKAVRAQLDSERSEYKRLKSATQTDRAATDQAIENRNAAAEAAKAALASGDTAKAAVETDKIRAEASKIKNLLANIKNAEDAFSVQFVSEKSVVSLDEFLSTIVDTKQGETPKADANRAAIALVLFPDLLSDVQKKADEAGSISLAPLVMQKQLSQIAKDVASKEISVRAKRIALLEQEDMLLQQQARMFVDIDFLMAGVPTHLVAKYKDQFADPKSLTPLSAAVLALPMADVLATRDGALKDVHGKIYATATQEERAKVWRAAMTYIDEGTRRHRDIVTIGLTLDLMSQQTALSYSEANVMQWNALVSTKVEQLALFGKSGLKAEQYSAFVNNLMLLWIGLRIPQ